MDEVTQDLRGFFPVYFTTQIAGIVTVILTGIWTGHYLDGFAWRSNPSLQFNWHPFLMNLGMIYLYGNGILMYRIFRNEPKIKLKLAHAAIMILVFILSVIALIAVFDFHNLKQIPNMYSLHSWMGILTVILFLFQWLFGFITFLFPGLRDQIRASYLDVHVFFGLLIFVCACATALMGITEKAIFGLGKNYGARVASGLVANCIGISIFFFAILVVYLVVNPRFKRLTKLNQDQELT